MIVERVDRLSFKLNRRIKEEETLEKVNAKRNNEIGERIIANFLNTLQVRTRNFFIDSKKMLIDDYLIG